MPLPNLSAELQQMRQLLQQGKSVEAISKGKMLIVSFPHQPDLLHILAVAYKNNQAYKAAVEHFNLSLSANPAQKQVHNNLANTYKLLGEYGQAEAHYIKAISYDKYFLDAHKNLGLCYLASKSFEKAEDALKVALSISPNDLSVLTAIANVYKDKEEFETAMSCYQQVLKLDANYVNALNNLGLTYKLTEQHDYAISCFAKARELAPNTSEVDFNLANTLFEQGKYEQAEQYYWSALNKKPSDILTHQTLNEFYWQLNQKEKFGNSFRLAIEHMPKDLNVRSAYAKSLLDAQFLPETEQALNEAFKLGNSPELLNTQGRLHAIRNENHKAIENFEKALAMHFSMDVALDLINMAIVECQYERALEIIAQAEIREPFNQLLIAYKGTCWRLMSDDRYEWLIDYQNFIAPYQLPTPNGYISLPNYLEELEHVLLGMHNTEHEPLKQTLKNGTQTPGRLLHKKHPVIAHLKSSLEQIVHEYIDKLPSDKRHPLLARKSEDFAFAGSWSVKLQANGFHVNHVHPAGWLSSSFYIKVPDFGKSPQDNEHAGAIKFGESSMSLGEREHISRIIQPSAGTLVLFPSYVWHGTVPFNGSDEDFRLTSPFDVIPR